VHAVIYEELCVGVVDDASRDEYRRIMRSLADRGAQAILLGCTEIDLLVGILRIPVDEGSGLRCLPGLAEQQLVE
jgi:aspartate racemase